MHRVDAYNTCTSCSKTLQNEYILVLFRSPKEGTNERTETKEHCAPKAIDVRTYQTFRCSPHHWMRTNVWDWKLHRPWWQWAHIWAHRVCSACVCFIICNLLQWPLCVCVLQVVSLVPLLLLRFYRVSCRCMPYVHSPPLPIKKHLFSAGKIECEHVMEIHENTRPLVYEYDKRQSSSQKQELFFRFQPPRVTTSSSTSTSSIFFLATHKPSITGT